MKFEKLKTLPALFIISVILSSCNQKSEMNESLHDLIGSQNVNLDERYVGAWKLMPELTKNDNSMEGIICNLGKYSNADKTYVFHLFTGNDLILSIQDNNNLKGENANMNVEYNEANKVLSLSIPGGSTWVFKKLK